MMFCAAFGCHYPSTHTAAYHKCGKCSLYGHGQVECGDYKKIIDLLEVKTEIPFDLRCCATNCTNIQTHTTDGHKCTFCHDFGHDNSECPIQKWETKVKSGTTFGQVRESYLEKKNLQFQARKQLGWSEKKSYTKIPAGMGCIWYARRNNTFDKIELFFMHSDNWGQYGIETDDRPKLNAFIDEYTCIDKE